jgi:hypothetical protein
MPCYVPDQSYGNKLRYAAIRVNLTLNSHTQNYVEGLPIMNMWEDYLAGWVSNITGCFCGNSYYQ